MQLEQALLYARINTSGDDARDLHALARKRLHVVSVAVTVMPWASRREEVGRSRMASSVPVSTFLRASVGEGGHEA